MTPLASIEGTYDHLLVVLSVGIAVLASYAALDLAERVTAARGTPRLAWLLSGGLAMGIGIWSMHYTAMLALRLPVLVLYDWPTAVFSLLLGIVFSIIALYVVSGKSFGPESLLVAGILQGAGIAALHYTSMAAMRSPAKCEYSSGIVMLSIVVAVAGSLLSLWLTFIFRERPTVHVARKVGSALLMGAAISAMHYTGMAAVRFTASAHAMIPDFSHAVQVTSLGAAGIVTVPWMVLLGTVTAVLVDRMMERSAVADGLFENAPASLLMDKDRRVVRVNPEFTRLFGYTPQEALGRRLVDLITTPDLEHEVEESWQAVLRGQRVTREVDRRRKDGACLHVLVAAVPVPVRGRLTLVCAMYRDITQRRQAEIALQTLSRRLLEVQEMERRHLARELHDEIGQLLTYLRLLLRSDQDSSTESLQVQFERARTVVDDLLTKVRGMSFDLRPADLDQLGLLPSLLTLFERYSARTGVMVDFKHQGLEQRFRPELETGAYRVVQEALTNVARHSGGASVIVRLRTESDFLKLQIVDEGSGFDLKAATKTPRSSGLYGLRERITLLGGSVRIESIPGHGTTIAAELPLVKPEA